MPKKKTSKKSIGVTARTRHDDLPATVGLVKEVRSELVAETKSVRQDMSAMEGRLNARIDSLDGRMDQVIAGLHRTQALMEEQRGENKIVLDGIKSVLERQDRVEEEVKEFHQTIQILVRAKETTQQ